mgnify:CR=1 FL=1|tara:strand:+ start:37048 stop:37461 length:414 start_codon:yes stop_codon:yes gene_type:complete
MKKLLLLFLCFTSGCSDSESELSEKISQDIMLRGKWIIESRTLLEGSELENCNSYSNTYMEFKAGDKVTRNFTTKCKYREETGTYYFNNLNTIVFSSYVLDVQNLELSETRLSFEYPTNIDDVPPLERVKEVYKKAP